jgi:hypothetical protein
MPCLANAPMNGIIHAAPGTIHLTLVDDIGHIFFDPDPKATFVTDGNGGNIPVTCDATTLSFNVASGNSYQLIVVHVRNPPGSRGYLVEDCPSNTPLGILSDADTFAEFDFVVF